MTAATVPFRATTGKPITKAALSPVHSGNQTGAGFSVLTASVSVQHKAGENVGTTKPAEDEYPDLTQPAASSKNKTIIIGKITDE